MDRINPKSLVGKTLTAIDCKSVNCWKLTWDDGTATVIDTLPGPAGIPALIAVTYDPKDYNGQW